MDTHASADVARQRLIVAFRARFAVVKGYAQLLARQMPREDISRQQLASHSANLQHQLELLETLARQLLYDNPTDELLDETVKPSRPERNDGVMFS